MAAIYHLGFSIINISYSFTLIVLVGKWIESEFLLFVGPGPRPGRARARARPQACASRRRCGQVSRTLIDPLAIMACANRNHLRRLGTVRKALTESRASAATPTSQLQGIDSAISPACTCGALSICNSQSRVIGVYCRHERADHRGETPHGCTCHGLFSPSKSASADSTIAGAGVNS